MNFAQKLQKRRKEVGFSQEQLAFELNVSRQAVSKWESGQGYPEVEKLIQLSDLLGISLDELMKETRQQPASFKPLEEEEQAWMEETRSTVTLPDDIHEEDSLIGRFAYTTDRDTVERYLDLNQRFSRWISVGVGFILCGVMPVIAIDNDLGVAIMMFFIAIGVGLLVKNGMDYQEIEKLEKQTFHLSGELICDLQDDYERYQRTFTRKIVAGVSLIIFGVGLMLILNSLFGEYDANAAVLFPFIAVSVGNFIDAGITSGAYRKLLNIKD